MMLLTVFLGKLKTFAISAGWWRMSAKCVLELKAMVIIARRMIRGTDLFIDR